MINKIYAYLKNYIKENYKFLIGMLCIITFCFYDTGYSIYKPGGTINESERITGDVYTSKGSFNMAYVSMLGGTLPYYLIAKVIPSWELVKNTDLTYNDKETITDSEERDRLYYDEAVSNAKLVAYKKAGVKYSISSENVYIIYLTDANKSDLKIGDELLKYDYHDITNIEDLSNYISNLKVGDQVTLTYKRNGEEKTATATVYEEKNKLYIGISILKITNINSQTKINIKTKASESGPSGGLIMALSIYDALTKEDITHGKKIVGTGTIDQDGNVGEIGSVEFKLASAVKDHADIFLCPEKNYQAAVNYAKKNKYAIIIKGVKTFDEALNVLKQVEE